jgi:co-chaperonin GroES (HSP10)
MSKTIFMADGSPMSEEQRAEMQQATQQQEEKSQELLKREIEKEQSKKKVTIEELLVTRIAPAEDRVVIYPDPVEMITEGGILKPKEAIDRERPNIGTVIAVGPGLKTDPNLTNELLLEILREASLEYPDEKMLKNFEQRVHGVKPVYVAGDRVIFGQYAGTPIEDPSTKERVLIMRPGDIFAKI